MTAQDTVLIAIGVAVITGVCTLLGSVLSKRMSSTSDDQSNLNNSFRLFMESQDEKYESLKREHVDCNEKLSLLQGIILKLVRALREKGIPLPLFSFPEQMLLLDNKSFVNEEHLNGRTKSRAPPEA